MKSLPFHIPEAWKRYPFRAEPPRIGHYRPGSTPPQQNTSKRPHVQGILDNFFPKRSKGESLKHYKVSFQHNELSLADMNEVCVLHVKRVIEPQRPLNTNNEPAPLWLSIFMRNLLNCKFLTVVTRWLIYVANLSDIKTNIAWGPRGRRCCPMNIKVTFTSEPTFYPC